MPRKVFTAGEILTAADVNTNLMDQAVMVFDDSAARGSAIPSPSEGMVTYLKDTDAVEKFDGSNFVGVATPPAILQVVSVTLTAPFTAAAGTWVAITGLSASITPSSATSKILVTYNVHTHTDAGTFQGATRLTLGGSAIGVGDASSSRLQTTTQTGFNGSNNDGSQTLSATFLDAPASTSALTYAVEVYRNGATIFVNRSQADLNSDRGIRPISTITLMEVAG